MVPPNQRLAMRRIRTRPAARAPPAVMRPRRRQAWLRIFVVQCSWPCDPQVIHAMEDDTTLLSLASPPYLILARLIVRTTPSKNFETRGRCRWRRKHRPSERGIIQAPRPAGRPVMTN